LLVSKAFAIAEGVALGPAGWIQAAGKIVALTAAFGVAKAAVSKFALGGDFVTSGPQMIMVGDNPGGRERVRVDPVSSPNVNGSGSAGGPTIEINIHNVTDSIIDSLSRSIRSGNAPQLVRELRYAGAV
jgi:hypothetical protein